MPAILSSRLFGAGCSLGIEWSQGKSRSHGTAAGILALTVFFAGTSYVITGLLLVTPALIGMAAVASVRTAHFFLSFLAVQCV